MQFYNYTIGEVTLSLASLEKEKADEFFLSTERAETPQFPLVLSPSLEGDGELLFPKKLSHLLPEMLSAAAYHLKVTRGLPLYEYTFLVNHKSYTVNVTEENAIAFSLEKCKRLYSNIDISGGKLSVFANVYGGVTPTAIIATDNLSNIDPTLYSTLLMKDARTCALPFLLYERGKSWHAFCAFSPLGERLPHSLSFYLIFGEDASLPFEKLTLPFIHIALDKRSISLKVFPKGDTSPLD